MEKNEKEIKVAVVHTKEKVLKNDNGKVTGPDEDAWKKFINSLGTDVDYMVGDTNMTTGKAGKSFSYDKWWKTLPMVKVEKEKDVVVPKRKINKKRLGKSEISQVNGFLNNQINKGGDAKAEKDGMVILKLDFSFLNCLSNSFR